MAGKRISELETAGALTGAEVLEIVQNAASKKETLSNLLAHLVEGGIIPYNSKKYKIVSCVIRNDGTGWKTIETDGHASVGVASVSADTAKIILTYDFTATEVGSLLAVSDETFAVKGLFCGASVGLSVSNIFLSRALSIGGYAAYDGAAWCKYGNISSVVFSAGKLTINIENLGTGSGLGSPVLGTTVQLRTSGGARPDIYPVMGACGSTYFEVYFYDAAGSLITTPNSDMKVFVSASGTVAIDPSDLVDVSGNIWIFGIFEVA